MSSNTKDCGKAQRGAMVQAITSITLVLLVLDRWEMGNMMAESLSREMTIMMKPER